VVRGRRRQGKSFMLRRLAKELGGFYYQAVEEGRSQALAGLGAALGDHLDVPGGRLALTDWQAAIDAFLALPRRGGPRLVVLDEFPYLLAHSPELPSLLQRAFDRSRDGSEGAQLILCGSALSSMAGLLAGTQALRGRVSLDLVVGAFDYRTARAYWDIGDAHTAFHVHAVLGGTPGYRDLLPAPPPRSLAEFPGWLAAGPLNPASALFREDAYLLTEERALPDRALYHAVIAAIGEGATSQSRIAAELGRDAGGVQHALRALEATGFVTRTDDALRSRRPIYLLADPIVRFHHVVTRRDPARFEERRTDQAWADALPRFSSNVLGPHFEWLAREFAFRFASELTLGGAAVSVAPAVVNDATGRTQHELDVVVQGPGAAGRDTLLALGEAKHSAARMTMRDLARLERIRELVSARHPAARGARLLLFSATGFDQALESLASSREGIELIDLERMYAGD
ncbi:MAG: AAA family ATPase, partial [Gaiella sp.]